jgi:hypothetical protein
MLVCADSACSATSEVVYGLNSGSSGAHFTFAQDRPVVAYELFDESDQLRRVPVLVSCSDVMCSDMASTERVAPPPPSGSVRGPDEELLDLSASSSEPLSLIVVGTGCPACAPALVDPQLALVTCTDEACTRLATIPVAEPIPTGPDGNTWNQVDFAARLLDDPNGYPIIVRLTGGLARVDFPPDEVVAPIEVLRCHDLACTTYTSSAIDYPDNVPESGFDAVALPDGTVAIIHATPTGTGEDTSYDLSLTLCPTPACQNTQS